MGCKAIAIGCLLVSGSLTALLVATNPGPQAFEQFAVASASAYLKEEVCRQPLPFLGSSMQQQCLSFVDHNQALIAQILQENTRRQNYGLFSIYATDLNPERIFPVLPAKLLPRYEVKTMGVLRDFHILEARSRRSAS